MEAYFIAKNQVTSIKNFYGSALSFAIVIPLLILVNYYTYWGFKWFVFPMLGWGLGFSPTIFRAVSQCSPDSLSDLQDLELLRSSPDRSTDLIPSPNPYYSIVQTHGLFFVAQISDSRILEGSTSTVWCRQRVPHKITVVFHTNIMIISSQCVHFNSTSTLATC